MDIDQMQHYIKLHQTKYLTKLLQSHTWLNTDTIEGNLLSLPSDPKSLLLHCSVLTTTLEQEALQQEMGFKYRHDVMGEILYPMVKCCPNISTHAIILSQYANNPGKASYIALQHLLHYLVTTRTEGIHYW
jgi:hypothetical protein